MSSIFSNRIELENVAHSFNLNESRIELFNNLSVSIVQGQSYAITGPSGSGKSSLLTIMSGLEKPADGVVTFTDGERQSAIDDIRENIGFIFQQFHLLPELSALYNVALPLKLRGDKQAEAKAKEWLAKVGLAHRFNHKPKELSGGEQQRVAIARALVFNPMFIFADEPTGNLDAKSANDVADILFSCCRDNNAGLIVVTHSNELANRAENILTLDSGTCRTSETNTREVA